MSVIEQWSELPFWRRYCYFYVCLLLFVLASRDVIHAVAREAATQSEVPARTSADNDERIGNTDLSAWLSPKGR
jgi:hypothetical protein